MFCGCSVCRASSCSFCRWTYVSRRMRLWSSERFNVISLSSACPSTFALAASRSKLAPARLSRCWAALSWAPRLAITSRSASFTSFFPSEPILSVTSFSIRFFWSLITAISSLTAITSRYSSVYLAWSSFSLCSFSSIRLSISSIRLSRSDRCLRFWLRASCSALFSPTMARMSPLRLAL